MTKKRPSIRDLWLSEMWSPVREVPREERAVERERNKENRRHLDDSRVVDAPVDSDSEAAS